MSRVGLDLKVLLTDYVSQIEAKHVDIDRAKCCDIVKNRQRQCNDDDLKSRTKQVQSIVGHTWFDESNLVETLGEARHERQRRCGFANMLFGSCNVNWSATVVLNTLRRWPLWHPFPVIDAHRDGIGTDMHSTIAILGIGQRVWVSRRVSGGECPVHVRTMTLT